MKQSAYVGLLAVASLCVATGCLKKKDSAAKSIVNKVTKEELVEKVLVMPVTSPDAASGMVSADPASIRRVVNDATAYCFASVMPSSDGTASPEGTYVTSNYVRAADLWALIDSVSGGSMDSSANAAETALGNVASGGNASGNGTATVGLSLAGPELLSASVPVAAALAAHAALAKPTSIVMNTAIDGTIDVLEHDIGKNVARILRFRNGIQIGDLPEFPLTDPRVAKFFKPVPATINFANVGPVTKKLSVESFIQNSKQMFRVTQFDTELGKIVNLPSRMVVDSLDKLPLDAAKKGLLQSKLLNQTHTLAPLFDAQQTLNFKSAVDVMKGNPRLNPKAGARAFGAWIKHSSSATTKQAARLANRAAMAAGQASSVGLQRAGGLISRCTGGDVKTKLICAAGATAVTMGAFALRKLAWDKRPTGGVNPNATATSLTDVEIAEYQALAMDHTADAEEQNSFGNGATGNTASGSPAPSDGGINVSLADGDFQRVKAGLMELGAKSVLPPCGQSDSPAL